MTDPALPAPVPAKACKWCGEPLPPRTGRRGRPPETHPGDCRRRFKNRRVLNHRIATFRAAHRPNLDRSVDTSALPAADYDAVAMGDGFDSWRGAYDDLHGAPLIEAMNDWESRRALHRKLMPLARDFEASLTAAQRDHLDALGMIPQAEYQALLARRPHSRPSPEFLRLRRLLDTA